MGIFDFFKKNNETPNAKEVNIKEAESLILKEEIKHKEILAQEKDALKEKVRALISNLNGKINELERINIDDKKEHERLKIISKENLLSYINHMEKLISDLEKNEEKSPENYVKNVILSLNNFKENSKINFEKATILIGKELEKTKWLIINFYKGMDERSPIFTESLKKINSISEFKKIKNSLNEVKTIQSQIELSIEDLENERKEFLKEKEASEREFNNFLNSEEYKKYNEKKERIKLMANNLKIDAVKLKEKINFKEILGRYHDIKDKMELIKIYKENLLQGIEHDVNLSFIEMMPLSQRELLHSDFIDLNYKNKKFKEEYNNAEILSKEIKIKDKISQKENKILEIKEKTQNENLKKQKFIKKENEINNKILEQTMSILDNVKLV